MNPALEQPRRKLTGAIVPALAVAALAGLAALFVVGQQNGQPGVTIAAPVGCILDGLSQMGGPISLIDQNGQAVTQADFSSGPTVVYFGFTHCPDVCPTTLTALGEAQAMEGGFDAQTAIVTLDPERDTPDVMNAYVRTPGFPAGLVGLSGSPQQVASAAEVFRVAHRRAPIDGAPDAYNVDHSSFIYVMDSNWRTVAAMSTIGKTPAEIAACVSAGLAPRS
jgi:protein SCO1/2